MRGFERWMVQARSALPRLTRMPHAAVALLVVVVVAVLAADVVNPIPGPSPSRTPSASSAASGVPSATPGPTGTPQAWAKLDVPPYNPLADLTPTKTNASGVSLATAFTLTSRSTAPVAELAKGLEVSPAIAFSTRPGATAATMMLTPKAPLQEGVTYRFRLADPTGTLLGTWAYQAEHPLHVVTLLPGNQTSGVPTNTGIEITFDQDGVIDLAAHFSIEPRVVGTFRTNGRTIAFVPKTPLAAATVYHVSISAGVTMTGSTQTLESPVTYAFETAGPPTVTTWDLVMGRAMLETTPREPPVIAVDLWAESDTDQPASVPLQIYRLPTIAVARAAATRLLSADQWASYDTANLVATDGLTRVLDTTVVPQLQKSQGYRVLRLPAPLAQGWYLVVVPRDGRDRQALLQVTDLAAWAATSETRTIAWVHDLASGDPIDGATFVDPAGTTVATTGSNGLIDIATPVSLVPVGADSWSAKPTLATIAAPDGRRLLVPLGISSSSGAYAGERNSGSSANDSSQRYWLLSSTDRTIYRPTDTLHAWGLVRDRSDGSVPAPIEVRLRAPEASETAGPWLSRVTVRATTRGTWTADLAISGLPYGGYLVDVVVDKQVVSSMWISVEAIRKPAYQIDVTTAHRVFIEGDHIAVTGVATYFDGTVVPGINLRAEGLEQSVAAITNDQGVAQYSLTARAGDRTGYWSDTIGVAPNDPEEGQISGSTSVVVFPSEAWLESSVVIKGDRIELTGSVTHVDMAAVERQLAAAGWPEDPAGAAFAGRTVTVRVVELIPTARQVGTDYDFIEKRTVPVMEYSNQEHATGTYTTTSGPDGKIALSIAIPDPSHEYRVTVTARDAASRVATLIAWAAPETPGGANPSGARAPYLDNPNACGYDSRQTGLGQAVTLTMHNGDGTPSTGQHLFIVASGGIKRAVLQSSPVFTQTFDIADLPSLEIFAVRFGAGGYVVTEIVQLRAKPDERALTVTITTDRARYAPGDTATIQVRTTAPDGSPVPADVVLRGVDEKLYAIGGATDIDALAQLLQPIADGLFQSATTHVLPQSSQGGCGDTTGGGRDDFRDSILFRMVSTGTDGRATVAVPLPDDITSWHVSGTALDAQLRAGDGSVVVPVGLPFFADAVLAPEFLVGEQPVLRVRSAGDSLTSGDRVRYTVSAPSLLMNPTTVEAAAFDVASIPLPAVSLGTHGITIDAVVVGHDGLKDRLTRQITVRNSRLEVASSVAVAPASAAGVGGPTLTTYAVTDAGRGALLPATWDLAYGSGARLDRALAAQIARQILQGTYAVDPATLPLAPFDIAAWQHQGIALLPYASTDLELSALAAIVAPEYLDRQDVDTIFSTALADSQTTDERRIVALAGEAGLGFDRLGDLRSVNRSGLSARSSLWLALGLIAAGDENAARAIERDLLSKSGQELGPWVRLSVGSSLGETVEASSLLALVAAGIGDPVAPRVLRYLEDNPVKTFLPVLHEAGAIRWLVERLPKAAARFAWTVDGARHEETLEPGATRSIVVTAAQRAGLVIEPLAGSIAIVATWSGPPATGDLPSGDLVTVTRTVTPAGTAGSTSIVRVTLKLDFSLTAPLGCYEVTDHAPSGLAPLASLAGWQDEADSQAPRTAIAPWLVQGQAISWCVDPANGRLPTLAYSARVVSPGTYTWEPAVVQLGVAPESGAATGSLTYTIR